VTASNQIPESILNDPALAESMSALPSNYNFEVAKCIWKIRQAGAKRVGLQMPEGLLLFACPLADILGQFTGAEMVVLGDVTYGACCVDDLGALSLGCDFLIHYGHSCLVPVDTMSVGIKVLYVFVSIAFDVKHLCDTVVANFPPGDDLVLAGTIQFSSALAEAREILSGSFPSLTIPQAKPLSPGEVLGCTAPSLAAQNVSAIIFVADGRFHLEAIMMRNPGIPTFRYDPYGKRMTEEGYNHGTMNDMRRKAITSASQSLAGVRGAGQALPWGCVLGTLGRQGNPALLDRLTQALTASGVEHFTVLMAELSPSKLKDFGPVGAWVQVACPRLSIDWGAAVEEEVGAPLLTPFEAFVALGLTSWDPGSPYPMDYYERGRGPWTNYHKPPAK
jgi:2-(3-amino-3-carboxypropyl)histidine synthase